MKESEKTLTGKPREKEVHVKIRGTDYDISEVRKRELSSTGHALSRDELAAKGSPEPFGV